MEDEKTNKVRTEDAGTDSATDALPAPLTAQALEKTQISKYYSSSGNYRYPGQVLEVPKDQYETCVELMRDRIAKGKVPGFENPQDAEKIVQQGRVTYKQARNIARAGNIDSLMFDTRTQAVTCTYLFALSFAVNFAQSEH
jgi:hypothetical protein